MISVERVVEMKRYLFQEDGEDESTFWRENLTAKEETAFFTIGKSC